MTARSGEAEAPRARPAVDSVERALAQVGDAWTFLLLREAYFGVRRFDGFLKNLGAAPTVLTARLKKMVDDGLLERRPYQERPMRHEYRLTAKGRDLYPAIVMLMRWGDRWLSDGAPPIRLRHTACGAITRPVLTCDVCGQQVSVHDVTWEPGADGGGG